MCSAFMLVMMLQSGFINALQTTTMKIHLSFKHEVQQYLS